MAGRLKPGVGGIVRVMRDASGFVVEGVSIVSPRLLGFLLGGAGGLVNDGDMMLDPTSPACCVRGKLDVDAARPEFVEVLTARFLRFRPFFSGGAR